MRYEIPLKQHIGAPCVPVVQAGDTVQRGQLLGRTEGLGAPLHSPFSGKISSIENGSIFLEADEKQPEDFLPLEGNTPEELLKASGLVGMGGAGFPTAVKVHTDLKGGYLLVNAAECEPLLHHNIQQLETVGAKTLEGVKILMKLCNAAKALIAIKAKHEEAVVCLRKLCEAEPDIDIHLLPDLYPMGEERAIVRECLGVLLPPTALPSAAGAVVTNVETVLRAAEAVLNRRPVITKNVSVAGKLKGGTHTRVFMDVPIGTTVGELIRRAGGIDGEYGEIIMGGPFTGKATTLEAPVTKTTGGILVTEPFPDLKGAKTGLLLCACGGNQSRMEELAKKMNADVVLIQKCKQAADIKGTLKCENPGNCPGQAQKCLNFKKAGCTDILIGNCSDCTNTVMGSAPKLGLTVHHQTDHVFDTVGMERMRYLTKSKTVEGAEKPQETAPDTAAMQAQKNTAAAGAAPAPQSTGTAAAYEIEQSVEGGILKISIKEGKNIYIELPLPYSES